MSSQPDPALFARESRARRLQAAAEDIESMCDGVVEAAIDKARSSFEEGNLEPVQALQLLARIDAARSIRRKFRKAVKDGVAASEAIRGGRG